MFESQLLAIASGKEGTKQTLEVMRRAVLDGTKDSAIPMIARMLVVGAPEKDQWAESLYLFQFVADNIRYVKDIYDRETVLYPRATIEVGSGDCDDKAVLFAALAHSIGHQSRFTAVRLPGKDIFTHVYPELFIGGAWRPYELTVPGAQPGVLPAKFEEFLSLEVVQEDKDNMYWNNVLKSINNPVSGLGDIPSWYRSLYSGVLSWQEKLANLARILEEVPRYPEYAKQGQQIKTAETALKEWLTHPMTWVTGGVLLLLAYKYKQKSKVKGI